MVAEIRKNPIFLTDGSIPCISPNHSLVKNLRRTDRAQSRSFMHLANSFKLGLAA